MQIVDVLTQYSKLDRPFKYYYNGDKLLNGVRVLITFNNREIVGYVIKVETTNESIEDVSKRLGIKLETITRVIDDDLLLTSELLEISDIITDYYLTSKISVLNAMLPPSLRPTKSSLKAPKISMQTVAKFNSEFNDFSILKERENGVLNEIITRGSLIRNSKNKNVLTRLFEKGAVIFEEEEKYRLRYEDMPYDTPKALTNAQKEAVTTILDDKHQTFLLHGVTGSGKTEVYLSLAASYLKKNKQVLILVPEIALTGMMLANFYRRFGRKIAILHSELTPAEKYDEYRRIRRGEVDIVVGARSAIFAPLTNIGLIILDEEHADAYKQDSAPFYHALHVAIERANKSGAKIVLGSATPSIESMARARKDVYGYYFLEERINKEPLPQTIVVDMFDNHNIQPKNPYISKLLTSEITKALSEKHQVILLVNRRGYAPVVRCRSCNSVKKCETCGISLTYHKTQHILKCHHCGARFNYDDPCEKCGGSAFLKTGFATQRAEEEIATLFPNARILRLDSDVSRRDKTPQKVLSKFANHEADILIGTQMVAKGHDFPLVSLVGVIGTDASLLIPSFRSGERTFQLITQAIGRGGRGDVVGKAIIQTTMKDHYVIKYAKNQDYIGFYNEEMRNRKLTKNPPFYFQIAITLSHQDEGIIDETIMRLKYNLSSTLGEDAIVIGPSTTFVPQSGKNFSQTLIVKYKNYHKIKTRLIDIVRPFKEESSFYVQINVDPFDI